METFNTQGYNIPVSLMLMTGGGPDTFEAISEAHICSLQKHIGIDPGASIVEIGCGIGRDAIPLSKLLSANGSYLGIDIIKPSIDWCRQNISTRHPNFKFVHFDVKDQLHNPAGTEKTTSIRIPVDNDSVEVVILQSVFTHMFRQDILHYLKEFRRILKPNGKIYATVFIVNEEILRSARRTNLTKFNLLFMHEWEPGCLINDPAAPAGAVAYTAHLFESIVKSANLKLTQPYLKGSWSGYYENPDDGQDVAIIGRPSADDRKSEVAEKGFVQWIKARLKLGARPVI
jgi:ubiquinone/menaquinone biosynthesis C-methylase UbiE